MQLEAERSPPVSLPCLLLTQWEQHVEIGRLRARSEEHTSELQSRFDLVCRLLLEKKKNAVRESLLELRAHVGDCPPRELPPVDLRLSRFRLRVRVHYAHLRQRDTRCFLVFLDAIS